MQHNNRPHSTTDEHKQFTEPYHIKKSSKEVSKTFRNVEYTVPLNDYHAKNWKLIRDLPLIETITITLSHKPASWSAVSRTKLNSGEYYTLMFESHDGYWDFAPCTIRIDQLIVMHAHGWLNQLSTQFRTSYITHGFSVFAFDWEGSGGPLAIKGEGFLDVTSPVLGRDIAHPDSKIVVKIREGLP